ncbi:MAG: hypothetical protein V4584_19105 [Verrucomicrobiota bacterium]
MNPWSIPQKIAMLSREPYGEGLATWLWTVMQEVAVGSGIMHRHRDYCGIGLIRDNKGVSLVEVEDGSAFHSIKSWTDLPEFVNYWSQQSDFGLSGADIQHPELLARSDYELNNQRLTRRMIYQFLDTVGIKTKTINHKAEQAAAGNPYQPAIPPTFSATSTSFSELDGRSRW